MKEYSIERIEGEMVLLIGPDGHERLIDALLFDDVPKEGDVVVMQNGHFVALADKTKKRRDDNNALLRRLLAQEQCFDADRGADDTEIGDSVEFPIKRDRDEEQK